MDQCIPGLDRGFESAIQAQHRKPALVDHQRTGGGIPVPQAEVPAAQRQAQPCLAFFLRHARARSLADIAQHEEQAAPAFGALNKLACEFDPGVPAVAFFQAQLARLRRLTRQQPPAQQVVRITVVFEDIGPERRLQQHAADHAQKRRGAWIGLENQTVFADAHVAQRRQVVELEIARLRRLEFALDAAQLFVLHFQMNLAHPQLMHHALHLGRRHGLRLIERRRFARQRLGLAPQVAGALERFIFGGHCNLPFDGYRCDRLCTHLRACAAGWAPGTTALCATPVGPAG